MAGSLPSDLDQQVDGQSDQQWELDPSALDDTAVGIQPLAEPHVARIISKYDKEFSENNSATVNEVAVNAATKLLGRPRIKMPRETSVLAPVFGGDFSFKPRVETVFNMSLVGALEAMTPVVSPSSTHEPVAPSAHLQAKRRLHIARLVQSEDDTRAAALQKFRVMVLFNTNSTKLGRTLLSFAGTLRSEPVLMQTFVDSFSNKATGTLTKRASSVWQFTAWLHANNFGDPFSQCEETLYRYVCHMRSSAMGATSCSYFLEALGFADGVMGIVGVKLSDVLCARARGVSHSMYLTKRIGPLRGDGWMGLGSIKKEKDKKKQKKHCIRKTNTRRKEKKKYLGVGKKPCCQRPQPTPCSMRASPKSFEEFVPLRPCVLG